MTIKKTRTFKFYQWNKPLAYLVGVYLGDGSIHQPKGNRMLIFAHQSIDQEFVLKTKSALEVVLGHSIRYREQIRNYKDNLKLGFKQHIRKVYETSTSNNEVCSWLVEVTKNKTIVPNMDKKYLVHLLSGFLDSDGHVSQRKVTKDYKHGGIAKENPTTQFQAGICGKGDKMVSIVNAFKFVGVAVGVKYIGKREVESYGINLSSLASSGICPTINRKFFNLCDYVNQIESSTTLRRTLVYTKEDKV